MEAATAVIRSTVHSIVVFFRKRDSRIRSVKYELDEIAMTGSEVKCETPKEDELPHKPSEQAGWTSDKHKRILVLVLMFLVGAASAVLVLYIMGDSSMLCSSSEV